MFIRVGNRIINTDHIVSVEYDTPYYGGKEAPKPNAIITTDEPSGEFGQAYAREGSLCGRHYYFFHEAAEAIKGYFEDTLTGVFTITLADPDPFPMEPVASEPEPNWNQDVLANEGMVSKSTVYSTEAELPF